MDIVAGRTAKTPAQPILNQPQQWRKNIQWATLDLSGSYKAAFDTALRYAAQIADPFGVIRTANQALDEVSQTHTKHHPRTTAAANQTRCIGRVNCCY